MNVRNQQEHIPPINEQGKLINLWNGPTIKQMKTDSPEERWSAAYLGVISQGRNERFSKLKSFRQSDL
jgi:hypothetical protein